MQNLHCLRKKFAWWWWSVMHKHFPSLDLTKQTSFLRGPMGSILNFSKIAYAHDVVKKWAYFTERTKYLFFVFFLLWDKRIKLFDKKEYSESLLDLFSALACTWLWRAFTRSCYWKKRKLSSISYNLAFLWLSNFVVEELLATQKISKFIPARTYSSKSFTFFGRKQNLSSI